MGDRQKRPWARGVASAATGRLNLAALGAAAVGAAALGSLPLLGVGLAAYAALVAWDLSSPQHWKKLMAPGDGGPELPDRRALHDPVLKDHVERLIATKQELARLKTETPPEVNRYVAQALVSLDQLERAAARLILRGDQLARYLDGVDAGAIESEMLRLSQQAARTTDADARAEFERARATRQQQRATIDDLVRALDRVHANLARIVATYEGLPARLVHLRTLNEQARDAVSGDVNQELDHMNQEMVEFEQTLKEVAVEIAG